MSRVRLVPIIFIVIISLAVLLGGWRAYLHFNLVSPLETTLDKVPGVQSVKVRPGSPNEIDIHLAKVPDLQSTYLKLTQTVGTSLAGSENLVIYDHRNVKLTDAMETQVMPLLLEGVDKGNYREMIQAVRAEATKLGMTARVTMDEHNVYVQLETGSYYLYKVMPYTLGQGGVAS